MPSNKNALMRYIFIEHCMRGITEYTLSEIHEFVNSKFALNDLAPVSERTIQDDIQDMQNIIELRKKGLPYSVVKITKKKNYENKVVYCYKDKSMSFFNINLNGEDLQKFTATLEILLESNVFEPDSWVHKLYENYSGQVYQKDHFIDIEINDYWYDNKLYFRLYSAIKNKQVLKVNYTKYSGEQVNDMIVHPYQLKRYNTRWYLICFNEFYKAISNFPLENITNIEYIANINYKDEFNKLTDFFEDIIGVTNFQHEDVKKVIIKCTKTSWDYIKTRPFHNSQHLIKEENDQITFEIEVKWNKELEKTIMAFGPAIEVLEPKEFRDKFRELYQAGYNLYK